ISFRKGEWYDQQLGQYVVGDTDLHDNPPIQIGLTGDKDFDYETTVHEFKHFIVDSLRLGEAAHSWIDSGDDHVGGSGVHVKKAHCPAARAESASRQFNLPGSKAAAGTGGVPGARWDFFGPPYEAGTGQAYCWLGLAQGIENEPTGSRLNPSL